MLPVRLQYRAILQAVTMLLCAGTTEAQISHRYLPKRVGDCVNTKIYWVGKRIPAPAPDTLGPGVHVFDPGSQVIFEHGARQVGYETVLAIEESRKGDAVRMCLVSIPRNCPMGDNRGRVYRTTNCGRARVGHYRIQSTSAEAHKRFRQGELRQEPCRVDRRCRFVSRFRCPGVLPGIPAS